MGQARHRIAVLFHENDRHYDLDRYSIAPIADHWRADGHDVEYVFGIDRFVPADLCFVHVDLTVVPDRYLEFARRYPIAVNANVTDIRKRTISNNLVAEPSDPWPGKVLVKSDLNCGGKPERILQQGWLWRRSRKLRRLREVALERLGDLPGRTPAVTDSSSYRLYGSAADVPAAVYAAEELVVERFLPEIEDGLYRTRFYHFLGDQGSHKRLASPDPIIKRAGGEHVEQIEPNDEIIAIRHRLRMDYGKLDYTVVDGAVHLIDANKTTGGAPTFVDDDDRRATMMSRRDRARGIYAYLNGELKPL